MNVAILMGVHVTVNIIDNLKKLTFSDHDLRKFLELHMWKYMTSVQIVEGMPIQLVPMDWDHVLEKLSIQSPMYMPHFVRTAEVNTCMK